MRRPPIPLAAAGSTTGSAGPGRSWTGRSRGFAIVSLVFALSSGCAAPAPTAPPEIRVVRPLVPRSLRHWANAIRAYYGDDAAEELDVVPSQGSGVWLTRALIDACANPALKVVHWAAKDGFELEPDRVRRAVAEAWLEAELLPLLGSLDQEALSFLGGDFARSGDLTVLWPGQLRRGSEVLRVPFAVELRNVPFEEQRYILFWLLERLPRFMAAALDARGLGAMLAELAMQRFGASRVEQVKATREWYRLSFPPLKARFEDRTIEIPRDADITQDLRAVRVDKGVPMLPEGLRIRSSRGGTRHGDAAIAAVLLEAASSGARDHAYDYRPARRERGWEGAEDAPVPAGVLGRVSHAIRRLGGY